jgi:hypothetical protein
VYACLADNEDGWSTGSSFGTASGSVSGSTAFLLPFALLEGSRGDSIVVSGLESDATSDALGTFGPLEKDSHGLLGDLLEPIADGGEAFDGLSMELAVSTLCEDDVAKG